MGCAAHVRLLLWEYVLHRLKPLQVRPDVFSLYLLIPPHWEEVYIDHAYTTIINILGKFLLIG